MTCPASPFGRGCSAAVIDDVCVGTFVDKVPASVFVMGPAGARCPRREAGHEVARALTG